MQLQHTFTTAFQILKKYETVKNLLRR